MPAGQQMLEVTLSRLWLCWRAVCLLTAGVALSSGSRWPCPPSCRCDASALNVNCSGGQLGSVPSALPLEVKLLNLSGNNIKTLVRQHFHVLTQLLHLDLSDNLLAIVEAEAFLGLQNLLTLSLSSNCLKILPAGAFAGLSNLKSLDLSDNQILVFLDFTFGELASLQFFKAPGNSLVFIANRAFKGLSSLRELELDGRNLTAVPTESFLQLGALTSLRFNHLPTVALPNFSFRGLERLKELVIWSWPALERLSENSLFGLNLTSLTVAHCNLNDVPYVSLHHLVYLVYLDLSFNPISCVRGNLLRDLLRLQEFHLVGASLARIEIGAFKGLTHLNVLNVTGNLLSALEAGSFHSLDALRTLGLDGNPLACDCRLTWLMRKRPRLDFAGRPPTCTTSLHLRGWNFADFSDEQLLKLLTCRPPRLLNRKRQDVTLEQGRTVVFPCSAEGDPPPSVSWLNPQLRPVPPIGRIQTLVNGTLEVRYAQPHDSGTYICVATNEAGNASLRVALHVQAFPAASKNQNVLHGWSTFPSASPGASGSHKLPFDVKTFLIAATIGFVSFFSSVSVCFVFMFFWSKGKGQIKHTATIAYVPRSTVSNTSTTTGSYMETGRFTMKLI